MKRTIVAETAVMTELEAAFPKGDPGIEPYGSRIVAQIRSTATKSKGGIIYTQDVRDTEKWNTQVAKVISVGSLAFKNRNTMAYWPEGAWCKPGEFVRVPKWGGDRWEVSIDGCDEKATYVIFNDLDIVGKVTGDPLAIKAFL